MNGKPPTIDELLASISDGDPVNWDRAEQELPASDRPRVQTLRDLENISDFSRRLHRDAEVVAVPERWGDLLILERIGQGAHAEVFRAWDPSLRRDVALKLLRTDRGGDALLDEGRAAARIRHPHAVVVHGIDRHDGRVGMWMELVRGITVEQQVRATGPLDALAACQLGIEIGSALEAAHSAGVLHRDVTPANIVRDLESRHVLADFGLGTRWDEFMTPTTGPSGTPMYMAPELFTGAPASEQSDVYALGMVLWFALSGRYPFDVATFEALRVAIGPGPNPPLRAVRPEVPATLATIVERAIAPGPEARFPNAHAFVEALRGWRAAPPRRARVLAVTSVTALVAIVAIVAVANRRASRPPTHAPEIAATPLVARPNTFPPADTYSVEATFLRRDAGHAVALVSGDRVRPGDRLSLRVRTTRPAWFYVLEEDDRGERYVLFPQPRFELRNPIPADSDYVLPGPVAGRENAWTVTSAGGREYFLLVASLEPVPEIEADLLGLPSARPEQPIEYAPVGEAAIERLRGVGGVVDLPAETPDPAPRTQSFDRFKALAGREHGVRGIWVRQIVFENPR